MIPPDSSWSLLRQLLARVQHLCHRQGLHQSQENLTLFRELWLPLSLRLAQNHSQAAAPWIQGILGSQGTGKTTLTAILSLILRGLGYSVVSLSLDDLYLNPGERQAKFPPSDPRHHYRGAPLTHDLTRGMRLLEDIKQAIGPVLIPRFDKSAAQGQGCQGEPEWVAQVDIVLFEGWFVGVEPIEPETFTHLPISMQRDLDLDYARQINGDLQAYQPLWAELDSLTILQPLDYRWSQHWRWEAEQKMKAQGKSGMSDVELTRFVQYFWQSLHPELFIKPMAQHPKADWLVILNSDHSLKDLIKIHP